MASIDDELAALEEENLRLRAAVPEAQQQSQFLGAALNSISQGLTFGFGDEMAAGLAALAKSPFSDKTFGEIYDEQLAVERGNIQQNSAQFPITSLAGNVAGGVVTGGAAASLGTRALSKVPLLARLAGLGAAEGALFGAGTADENKLLGAGQGAAVGAVGAPVGNVVGSLAARGGGKLLKPVIDRLVLDTPKRQAERIVNRAIQLDDLGPASAQLDLKMLGPKATLADLGDNLSGLARGVTAKPGRARGIASRFLDDRQAGQQKRLLKAAGVDFDIDDFKRSLHSAINSRASAASSFYEDAYSQKLEATDDLVSLLSRPTMKKSLKKAANILRDEGVELSEAADVRLVDAAARDISDQIGVALRGGKREKARRLINMRNDLLDMVDDQVPAYKQARNIFSSEAGLRDAANLGRSLFGRRLDLDDVAVALEQMPDGELQSFQVGAVRGLIDKLESTPESRNAAQKLIESPRARELLRLAFPDPKTFQKFLNTARAESQFSFTRNRVLGGSPTARISEEVGDLTKSTEIMRSIKSGDSISAGINVLRSIGFGDVSDETLELVAEKLFSNKSPLQSVIGSVPRQINEITRQGRATGGAVAGISTLMDRQREFQERN